MQASQEALRRETKGTHQWDSEAEGRSGSQKEGTRGRQDGPLVLGWIGNDLVLKALNLLALVAPIVMLSVNYEEMLHVLLCAL